MIVVLLLFVFSRIYDMLNWNNWIFICFDIEIGKIDNNIENESKSNLINLKSIVGF